MRVLEAVARDAPLSAEAHFHLGYALAMAERYDEAIAQFELTLRLDPSHVTARDALDALRRRSR
jgi:tetratricopeptide (TPR) repeat protein